jgi:hypothetical protein
MVRATQAWTVCLAVFGTVACTAPAAQQDLTFPRSTVGSQLEVRNMAWQDVRIYILRDRFEHRLGLITHMNERTFQIPRDLVGRVSLRIRIAPVGGMKTFVTDPILVGPDQHVRLTVHDPPEFSVFTVHGARGRISAGVSRERF